MKKGPIIAMLATLFVGIWLVLYPSLSRDGHDFSVSVGGNLIHVEKRPSPDRPGHFEFRVLNGAGLAERGWLDEATFAEQLGRQVAQWEARPPFERTLLGFFNISGWGTFGWIAVGLAGQIAFFGRMLVQWVVSEHKRESVVPEAFWWLSLGGGLCLFLYFVWRVDFVGVLGQSTGIVIYARNLKLIHKHKARLRGETPRTLDPAQNADARAEAEVAAQPAGARTD